MRNVILKVVVALLLVAGVAGCASQRVSPQGSTSYSASTFLPAPYNNGGPWN